LPVLPTAIRKNEVNIGETANLPAKDQEKKRTDWVMKQLAALLPEQERGVYA